jgi:hypothetical protein
MEALVLPALAVTLLVYLAGCAWLIFRPKPIERRRRRETDRRSRTGR